LHDLRSFLDLLDERGELVRIRREVSPRFEMPALMVQLEKAGKAFIFENVAGATFPLTGGLLSNARRLGLAVGQDISDDYDHRDHARVYRDAVGKAQAPRVVDTGPVKEVVLSGEEIDLTSLPVPTFFELDSGPFMTGAVGISFDSEHDQLNMGFYRGLILGTDRVLANASSMSDLRRIYAAAEQAGEKMPIALCIGVPPALLMAASGKTPPGLTELDIAGGLMNAPVELVKCETNDLLVPAAAEIVIEALVDPTDKIENTLGEFADQYGPETAPIATVTAITHRKNAFYYGLMAGRNPEHNTIGAVSAYGMQAAVEQALRAQFPNIREINVAIEPRLGTMLHMFISIDKTSDTEPFELIDAAFAADAGLFPVNVVTKRIVVVDSDVNVFDLDDVDWAVWSRMSRADKIRTYPDVHSWELERCTDENQASARIGIDATMDMDKLDKLIRPMIPGAENIRLEDYLDQD